MAYSTLVICNFLSIKIARKTLHNTTVMHNVQLIILTCFFFKSSIRSMVTFTFCGKRQCFPHHLKKSSKIMI